MATQIQVQLVDASPADLRIQQLRQRILEYRTNADAAMLRIKQAPAGSEELSAARKDFLFNTASALRLQDMLVEPC